MPGLTKLLYVTFFAFLSKITLEAKSCASRTSHAPASAKASSIAEAVLKNPIVRDNLGGGQSEVTMLWHQYDVPCKARIDYLTGSAILDVKTCADASPEGFARQIATFQYHVQAAHYANGFREVVGWDLDRFVFIAVESEAPYAVGCYTLDARSLQSGRILIERAAEAYRRALTMEPAAAAAYADEHVSAAVAAREGFIDELVEPLETRRRLAGALAGLSGPGEFGNGGGNIPL